MALERVEATIRAAKHVNSERLDGGGGGGGSMLTTALCGQLDAARNPPSVRVFSAARRVARVYAAHCGVCARLSKHGR